MLIPKKHILASNPLMIALAVGSLFVGLGASLQFRNFDWLSRFGALTICWGILMLARPYFTGIETGPRVYEPGNPVSVDSAQHFKNKGEPVPDWALDRDRSIRATGVYGPWTCFVGTLANGFGSLLNGIFGFMP